ncbi:tripartite tricarboxylate transporter TctB family protein [Rhizobium leguminosarum bv. viciae]|uniref:tripartite tricarboxylate transporter TctB family protein n=1 Tax=Rhizobium leguminosarum TaxID=384 RepID=UPI001441C70F|nr:tripartite tricarboxylate transporter TctB family protein [Rhizobium leguminosarum]NKK87425.1 tripartite tricarboxylate transporter TctB family protein [Rhizobium leguminosarum bv. viciae]
MIYLFAGAAGSWAAQDLPFGSGARMGAGYFPTIITIGLILFGLASVARAFVITGEAIGTIAWKSLGLILGAGLAFAVLVERAGFVVAASALLFIAATASQQFRFSWTATLGAVALVTGCALLFIKVLGLPMPAVGPVLQSVLPGRSGS